MTTYNRRDGLKRLLSALLSQEFRDMEILVGNDYTKEILTAEGMGIQDPRVRFVNHPENLGEVGNMNALLEMARGRYFTWQFDDDSVAPGFLGEVHRAFSALGPLKCLATSYALLDGDEVTPTGAKNNPSGDVVLISGREFLSGYCVGKLKTMGCTAVYDTAHLKALGGMPRLCGARTAIYGEYLLLAHIGGLGQVGWIDRPLVYHRVHEGSWNLSFADLDMFQEAGANLLEQAGTLLASPGLRMDFDANFRYFSGLAFSGVIGRLFQKHDRLPLRKVLSLYSSLKRRISSIEDPSCRRMARWRLRMETFHHLKTGFVLILKRGMGLGTPREAGT